MQKVKLVCTVAVIICAFSYLSAATANAEVVQSGHTVVDLSTGKIVNPGPVAASTDDEILVNGGFETGAFDPWYHDGAWTISTNGPHTGTYCAYDVGNHWLRQDFAPIPASEIVSVTLWERQPEAAISAVDFFYTNLPYSEDIIFVTSAWQQYNVTSFIEPTGIVNGIRVWGYSGGGPDPDETFFDDVSIQTAGAPDVSITLTPYGTPIVIPAGGGSFDYNVAVANNGTTPATVDGWIMVMLPDSTQYGPVLGPVNLTLAGGASVNRDRTQYVPAAAPPGVYTYQGYVGTYPGTIYDSDSFTFTKSLADGGSYVGAWQNTGESFENELVEIPTTFSMVEIHPNPFNPTATLTFTLVQTEQVKLSVYDLSGRRVAQLINGWREAGTHEVTFDASNLASGVYICYLEAGQLAASDRMILMK